MIKRGLAIAKIRKKGIQFLAGSRVCESVKSSVRRDQLGSTHEPAPRGTSQRTTNAHSPHAESRNILHGQVARRAHQQIERLRRDRGDDGCDLFARADTWCVQAIRPRVRVGLEPCNRFVEVRPAYEKALGASNQQRVTARLVNRGPCRPHSFNRNADVEQWMRGVAGRILDRQTRHARFGRESNAFGNTGCVVRKATLEIRIDRHIGSRHHLVQMAECHLA